MGTKTTTKITNPQIRKIWAEIRNSSLTSADLHDYIFSTYSKISLTELTIKEGTTLIEHLLKLNGTQDTRQGMATEKQLWLIGEYQNKLGWSSPNLMAFTKKYCHVDHTRFLTKTNASKLIEALKNINSRMSEAVNTSNTN